MGNFRIVSKCIQEAEVLIWPRSLATALGFGSGIVRIMEVEADD